MIATKSTLAQRSAFVLALISAGLLFGRESSSFWYVSQIFIHAASGLLLTFFWMRRVQFLLTAKRSWKTGFESLVLAVAALSGLSIFVFGVSRPFEWILTLHITSSVLVVLHGIIQNQIEAKENRLVRANWGPLLFFMLVGMSYWYSNSFDLIENEAPFPLTFADNTAQGEESPFFPSPASTPNQDLIPASFFLESDGCGRSGCHVDAVAQWSVSAHHLSSFNNQWYRKSIEYLQEVGGTQAAKWCAGCHDPALLFSGQMEQPVVEFLDTPEAHAGVTCVSCHAIKEIRNTGGNGAYTLEVPALHALATHKSPVVQFMHDQVMKLDPGPHRAAFMEPFMVEDQAAYCSTCHKVHLDKAVNDYRWLRGFNTYDNWQASGVSGMGARSFYQPETSVQCTDCHMSIVPSDDPGSSSTGMRDHRFTAANTAISVAHGNEDQLANTVNFLKQGHLSVDIFAISPIQDDLLSPSRALLQRELQASTSFAVGEEEGLALSRGSVFEPRDITGDLRSGESVFRPGSSYMLDVVVRSKNVGHFFPTGTTDAQEAWLEVQATDATGRVLIESGRVYQDVVDSTAHFYRSVLVDGASRRIDKRNAFATRSTVYVNLIPPGAADVAHYVLNVPRDAVSPISVSAKLNYRKFSKEYTDFAFGGTFDEPFDGHFSADTRDWSFGGVDSTVSALALTLPKLPIVEMAKDSLVLGLGPLDEDKGEKKEEVATYLSWNDYGIALLREGDLSLATEAFSRVTELAPEYVDGWVNVARVHIVTGDYDSALNALKAADTARSGYYKTTYFRGLIFKLTGNYEEAISAFKQVLLSHPKDRVVLNDLGRSLYLDEQISEAIQVLLKVLRIDAEDLTANYNLMLLYQSIGETETSDSYRTRYERFKADESASARARAYRAVHSADNNEANRIHVH